MEITTTFYAADRAAWRDWLIMNHATSKEIWLLYSIPLSTSSPATLPNIAYLDAVEEAICFGWIDGIEKRMDAERRAQRFTPRKPKSNWTELNKERARRMIANGLMTTAGYAQLPDLDVASFTIADDILAALQTDPIIWAHFQNFPPLYQRVRIGFIEEMRKQPDVFQTRLQNFLNKTRQNKQFGNWER